MTSMIDAGTIQWRGRAIPALLPGLEYDPERHAYKLNGISMPSVTTILLNLRGRTFYPANNSGANWGKSAHDHVYHYVKGMLDFKRLSDRMKPTIKGFQEGLDKLGVKIKVGALGEYLIYSKKFHFAGRFDFLFQVGDDDLLIDFKTGTPSEFESRLTGLQLGGYAVALTEWKIVKPARLRLAELNVQPDGEIAIETYKPREVMHAFLAYLTVCNYMKQI